MQYFDELHSDTENKEKLYTAVCWVKDAVKPTDLEGLNSVKDLTIKQKTPLRVLHRRSLMTRDKMVKRL